MRKTALRKVGPIGEANREARQLIAQIAEEKGLNYCELKLDGICQNWPLAPAHRHKRAWYQGDVALLSDYNQWLAACQACHNFIEHKAIFTEKLFIQLRPLPEKKKGGRGKI